MSHDPESFFYGDADFEMAELEGAERSMVRDMVLTILRGKPL